MRIPQKLLDALDNQVFFTVPQAAEYLHCDERTIRKGIAAWNAGDTGGIPSTRIGTTYRVPTSWLRALARPPEQGPCDLCGTEGPRVTDHCLRHGEARGTLCPKCSTSGAPVPLWYEGNCPDCRDRIRAEVALFGNRHPEAREPAGEAA